ncbi:MAG: class I SAM-dependent methyltransferase [Chromatiales bacterium]
MPVPLTRHIEPEILDSLAPEAAQARSARRDLRRVNALMGNAAILSRALGRLQPSLSPRRIVDLGAGDGAMILRVARRWHNLWQGVHLTLVDRSCVVDTRTLETLQALGWQTEVTVADVFEWLARAAQEEVDLVMANLFLHHFEDHRLADMFQHVADRATTFLACEPRRTRFALASSHLLFLLGCNSVTRHDAVASVRAGFAGSELSQLWPAGGGWIVSEWPAGLFSHVFLAQRRSGGHHARGR